MAATNAELLNTIGSDNWFCRKELLQALVSLPEQAIDDSLLYAAIRTIFVRKGLPDEGDFEIVQWGLKQLQQKMRLDLYERLIMGVSVQSDRNDFTMPKHEATHLHMKQIADYALLGLLAIAPDESERGCELRGAVTRVQLRGDFELYGWDREFPIDLQYLGQFPNLVTLDAKTSSDVVGVAGLRRASSLKMIELSSLKPRQSEALKQLLADPSFAPDLEVLAVLPDVDPKLLVSRPLRHLNVPDTDDPNLWVDIGQIHSLESLRLRGSVPPLRGDGISGKPWYLSTRSVFDGIEKLQSLTSLEVHSLRDGDLNSISQLEQLRVLEVPGSVPGNMDLTPLSQLPNLREVYLHMALSDDCLQWTETHPTLDIICFVLRRKKDKTVVKRLADKYRRVVLEHADACTGPFQL